MKIRLKFVPQDFFIGIRWQKHKMPDVRPGTEEGSDIPEHHLIVHGWWTTITIYICLFPTISIQLSCVKYE